MNDKVTTPAADDVIAATQTWLTRAVIGLNLCPFAKSVHVHQRIRYYVSDAHSPAELSQDLADELRLLQKTDINTTETTLLIHPNVLTEFIEYSLFLPTAEAMIAKLGMDEEFQIASFHPDYQFGDAEADDIENYTNRAPYPTLHLLRAASIAHAVAAFPDTATIYQNNIATLRRLGHAEWRRLWVDQRLRGHI
ncbi:MAG: DUF1415 domain-containing protein [Pseudomonadota bacterium]